MKKVVKINHSEDIKKDIQELINSLGGISKFINKNEKVLIKPSCNSSDKFPATTDLEVIKSVTEETKKQTNKITIGDSSGVNHKPTEKVFKKLKLDKLAKQLKVNLINFDNYKFPLKKSKKAHYLKQIRLTEKLDDFDKIIFLPTLRTHRGARFTMSLKLGMGFPLVKDRLKMHESHLEEKIAELNLYFKPSLIIMDGRKVFITNGPESGQLRKPNIILASTSRTSIDIEGLKILKKYHPKKLKMPIKQVPIIKQSLKLGID